MFTASLHTHVRSLFDADIPTEDLIKRIKELGGEGCAITDHGSLAAIEDYKSAFNDAGLKLIPGVELYINGGTLKDVGRRHLILLAKDDLGYHGISKIVTESNRTMDGQYPTIDMHRLSCIAERYQGHIICLSACMQGVICSVYLANKVLEKKILKIADKQKKYTAPNDIHYQEAKDKVKEAEEKVNNLILLRDETRRIAEQKFVQREKKIEKLPEEEKEIAKEVLLRDKAAAKEAAEILVQIKNELVSAKRVLTLAKQEKKRLSDSVDKWGDLENEISTIRNSQKSEEDIEKAAEANAKIMAHIFGKDCFFIELQYHGIPEEKICFPKAAYLAEKLGIPVVATNDVHILTGSDDDRLKRQILRSLRFKTSFKTENTGDKELYLKTDEELKEALMKILPDREDIVDKAISNIKMIYDMCKYKGNDEKHYPKFCEDANKVLEKEIQNGIKWRFPDGLDAEHKARLEKELPVIEKMGYADYHLIVKDFLEYGRLLGHVPNDRLKDAPLTIDGLNAFIEENNWRNNPGLTIGPGRGSAVGSLVCYLLGITNLDPLKYDLLFERFLNVERVSMPDIDSDIANTTRSKVIDYVKHKYGENAVCGIMTVLTQAPKGSIAIAAKFYGLKEYGESMRSLGDKISKDVPAGAFVTFSSKVDKTGALTDETDGIRLIDYLNEKNGTNNDALNILHWASVIENSVTAVGAHAAGIVISDNDDVSDYLPLRMNKKFGGWTTQCDMVEVEENGLLKFDFLGLKTLDVITEAMRLIKEDSGHTIDLLSISLEDKKVYKEIFQQAKTGAVFQFSSNGMKQMLKKFRPERFEDLIILNSMFRPGPEQYLDSVCDVKNGQKKVSYLCPQLEHILGKTYGAIVYQEQVMQIFQDLAGYSLGGADMVRRYMSKKKAEKLAHEREAFIYGDKKRNIKGCVANGISAEIANKLFDQMSEFAKYAFNKSHAAAYSYNAYITAWLKVYYPAEFFAAALDWAKDDKEMTSLLTEASLCKVTVLGPDVNKSREGFSTENGNIRFALSSIRGVKSAAMEIVADRANGCFNSLKDMLMRVKLNRTEIINLIGSGACDCFYENANRAKMKKDAEDILPLLSDYQKKKEILIPADGKTSVSDTVSTEEDLAVLERQREKAKKSLSEIKEKITAINNALIEENVRERLRTEKELLGSYLTAHPMDYYPSAEEMDCDPVGRISEGRQKVYGAITGLTIRKRKKDGAPMAFFTIEDRTGSIKACCFAKIYAEYGEILKEGNAYIFTGNVHAEETFVGTVSDDGEESGHADIELKLFVESVKTAKEKLPKIFAKADAGKEDAMIAYLSGQYPDIDGRGEELVICVNGYPNKPTGIRVSREALSRENVREAYT